VGSSVCSSVPFEGVRKAEVFLPGVTTLQVASHEVWLLSRVLFETSYQNHWFV
jgi:hypothetical protein